MKITDLKTKDLKRMAAATARAAGPDSVGVRAIRRELERRAASRGKAVPDAR